MKSPFLLLMEKTKTTALLDPKSFQSPSPAVPFSALQALSGRRYLFYFLFVIAILVYLPRISRFEAYLLVSTKREIKLLPPFPLLRLAFERSQSQFEASLRSPGQYVEQYSSKIARLVNNELQWVYCPPSRVTSFVNSRMLRSASSVDPRFERRCRRPIISAIQRNRALHGLSSDGKIQISPGDSVYLAGDSLMQGPATRISTLLTKRGIRVINESRVSTGLAYPQFFDWPTQIKRAISSGSADAVVVFLGANDTFDIYENGRVLPVGSREWKHVYGDRIRGIARFASQHHVALLWLGMPAMRRNDIQPYVPSMNRLYSNSVRAHGGLYLPTAEILGVSETDYVPFKRVDGHNLLTRAEDGVHFTPDGWDLVADSVLRFFKFG